MFRTVSGSSGMERSIHEMLKDAPALNDSDSAVHGGTPPPHVPNNCSNDTQSRPATINLTLASPTSQMCKQRSYYAPFILRVTSFRAAFAPRRRCNVLPSIGRNPAGNAVCSSERVRFVGSSGSCADRSRIGRGVGLLLD